MIELILIGLASAAYGLFLWKWFQASTAEQERQNPPQPTKYQTEPITLAVETHRGRMVVIAKSRNDRTILKESDLFPLSDELRKYHLTVTTVNELLKADGVVAEETTQNDPPKEGQSEAMGKQMRISAGEINHLPSSSPTDIQTSSRHLYELMREAHENMRNPVTMYEKHTDLLYKMVQDECTKEIHRKGKEMYEKQWDV